MSVYIQKFDDNSIVIRGNTLPIKDKLKTIQGYKFGYFGGPAGWMFPISAEATIRRQFPEIPEGYGDGPTKTNPREPIPYRGQQTQRIVSTNDISSLLMNPSTVVSNFSGNTRGGLRGSPPADDEEKDNHPVPPPIPQSQYQPLHPSVLQMITEMKETQASILSKLAEIQNEISSLRNNEV